MNFSFLPLFASPVMKVQLDLDLEKLTEFSFETRNKNKKGAQVSNKGGWQSKNISEEKHEEFIRLKKEINQYLQIYHSKVFQEMIFSSEVTQGIGNSWININEKHHYNEWHNHPGGNLSGAYYIKHDGSSENGNIIFRHPNHLYMITSHWPENIIKTPNIVSSEIVNTTPKSNTLLIFPSWLEHKVEANLKDNIRISLSFNSDILKEVC